MGNRAFRTAIALLITTTMALSATALMSSASAISEEPGARGLTLTAERVGTGNNVFIQLEGCPSGKVRLLVDGQPIGDYAVSSSGRLTETISYPSYVEGKRVKAYCFATDGYVFADIMDVDDEDEEDIEDIDDGKDDDTTTGVKALLGQNCKFFTDFSGLNVAGNTFIPSQNYGIVGLFPGPVLGAVDIFRDAKAGVALTTSNGNAIIKIALCKPQGKPGYTPDGLTVVAKFTGKGKINFNVIGCPAGNTVKVFINGVEQATTFVVNPGDRLNDFIVAPAGATTFKALCVGTGAFGITTILFPGGSTAAPADTTTDKTDTTKKVVVVGATEKTEEGTESEIGEAVSTDEPTTEGTITEAKTKKEKARAEALVAVKTKAAATKAKAGGGDDGGVVVVVLETDSLAVSSAAVELPPLDEGAPEGGKEGRGVRTLVSPLGARAASNGGAGDGPSIPPAQVGLGVLSAAGLLAFGGLRRASRSMFDQ